MAEKIESTVAKLEVAKNVSETDVTTEAQGTAIDGESSSYVYRDGDFIYPTNKLEKIFVGAVKSRMVLFDQDAWEEDEDSYSYKTRENYELWFSSRTGRFTIELYQSERKFEENLGATWLASYKTLDSFNAAIDELAAAIERGDKKFTFPPDDSTKDA